LSNLRRGYQRSAHNKKRRKSLNRKRLMDGGAAPDEFGRRASAICWRSPARNSAQAISSRMR